MSKRSRQRNRGANLDALAREVAIRLAVSKPGEAMPPSRGAPRPVYPVAVEQAPGALSPPPINDRFPTVIGASLSLSYLSSVFRLTNTGYRQQYVDLLNELLEQDPHLFSVVLKRILSSAVGRVEITPCKLPEGHADTKSAEDLAAFVETEINRIPDLTMQLSLLLWAVYHGITAAEKMWTRDGDGWHIERLSFVHSRRLSYPDYNSLDLYIWDQGQVYGWGTPWGSSPTNSGTFGLRIGDYPGKYVVHVPQLRGDYPWRDGIGRQTATWCIFKRVGARGASQYLERFAKSFMDVSYSTTDKGKADEAQGEDINIANAIAAAIGAGSGSYGAHPDTIQINPKSFDGGSSSKLTWQEWIGLCNAEMSKASLGGTLGTEVGKGGGNRNLGEVQERAEVDLEKYDATVLAETIRRDIVSWLVRLNRPNLMHLLPQVAIHIDPDPDPKTILALAQQLVDMGAPVDFDDIADQVGIALVDNEPDEDGKMERRRSYGGKLAEIILTLTKSDVPIDIDAIAKLVGLPILTAEQMKKPTARRTRLVSGGKDMPVEPDGSNDPNSPNYQPMAPPSDADGGGDAAPDTGPAPNQGKAAKTPGKAKDKGAGATSPKTAKKSAKTVKATDAEAAQVNEAIRGVLLLSGRTDKAEAQAVFDLLSEDYPKNRLDWILSGHWEGPIEVPIEDIDFSNADSWRASHEDVTPYAERIQKAIDTDGKEGNRKPVVLVKPKGAEKYVIVDGHHRTLASKHLDIPVLAYVAHVHVKDGPWMTLHSAQKKGSSKGSFGASYRTVEASYT